MTRRVFIPLALAAAALLGACKANDSAGSAGAGAAASKPGQKGGASAPATGTTEVHADGVRRVGPEQLRAMMEEGRVVLYDTRSKMAYDAEHIKGALSMPHDEVEARAAEFPKGKTLAFYCTWPAEQSSAGAALTLRQKGFEDTAALIGGMHAWKTAGLQTEGSAVSSKQ